MWQTVREEVHPFGLEVVTVALDTRGVEAAAPFIAAANASHPSLIDQAHLMGELFGVRNVPTGIWIDEDGIIVRPPETAFPGTSMFAEMMKGVQLPADADPYIVRSLEAASKIRRPDARYLEALRDWAHRGADSPYALSPDDVIRRSRPRPFESALAAAHFALAQHLWRADHRGDAIEHLRRSHRLDPDNWTYKRQAWSFLDPLQRPSDAFDGDWAGDVERLGPENYYPDPDL